MRGPLNKRVRTNTALQRNTQALDFVSCHFNKQLSGVCGSATYLQFQNSRGLSAFPQYFCNDQNRGSLQGMEDPKQSAGKAQCACKDQQRTLEGDAGGNWQIHLCCQGAGHAPFPELGSWHASREAFKDWFRMLTSITAVTELQGSSCLRNIHTDVGCALLH